MKQYILCVLLLALTACFGPREPTEAQMSTAAGATYMKINSDLAALAEDCRQQGSVIVNPFKAVKCSSVCALDPKECKKLPTINMANFKKLACEKAVGQPGWVCDYQYEMASESSFVMTMFETVYGKENHGKGRFFEADGQWIMVSDAK